MSGFGIEFGNRFGTNGVGGFEHLRETRDNLKLPEASPADGAEGASFGDFLKKMVNEANSSQLEADHKLQEVAAGRNKDLRGAVLSLEKADVDFRMLTQVRNKVIDAYREIMRMQV